MNAPTTATATTMTGITLVAKVLVISADGTEADLPAIQQALNYLGTPYDVWIATKNPGGLTSTILASGTQGNYQGVILTTDSLTTNVNGTWASALTTTEWTALYNYEATFGVRQVNWYSFPSPALGFASWGVGEDSTTTPIQATVTSAGQKIFPYLNAANPLTITSVWAYLAQPSTDASVTPLLVDPSGNAIAVEQTYADGRDWLTVTVDGNQFMVHTLALQYGLINWVTKGVFIGERHVYAAPQIDDLLLESDVYGSPTTPYRMSVTDLDAALSWQTAKHSNPVTANLTLNWAYNGGGAFLDNPTSDPLATEVKKLHGSFNWISHTLTHPDLTALNYADVYEELTKNIAFGEQYQFFPWTPTTLVTPGVTGLANSEAMRAIRDAGVQYIVSDTSMPGQDNPTPNAAIPNALVPSVLEVPRRPTNLFYNVYQPDVWAAEYNSFYQSYWGMNLTPAQIEDKESNMLLMYMLRWEMDPWMFHQENLGLYDGQHTLLTDLLDATFAKYMAIETTPLVSLTQEEIGHRMQAKMELNNSGVSGIITPGVSVTLTVKNAATVPVTGLNSMGAELYDGQTISHVDVAAGQTVTLPLQ